MAGPKVFLKRAYLVLVLLIFFMFSGPSHSLRPEDVLGEYWKDPLFGRAAADQTVNVEVLQKLLWPKEIALVAGENIRFVVTNKSAELHLLAFASDPELLLEQASFKRYMAEDVYHANMQPVVDSNHSHAGTSVDDPKPIVLTMDRNPSVIVKPDEFKEVIVNFDTEGELFLFCALDDHRHEGYLSTLRVTQPVLESIEASDLSP